MQNLAPHLFEPFFNGALLAYKLGDFQESFDLASKVRGALAPSPALRQSRGVAPQALEIFPEHHDSIELLKLLRNHFTLL